MPALSVDDELTLGVYGKDRLGRRQELTGEPSWSSSPSGIVSIEVEEGAKSAIITGVAVGDAIITVHATAPDGEPLEEQFEISVGGGKMTEAAVYGPLVADNDGEAEMVFRCAGYFVKDGERTRVDLPNTPTWSSSGEVTGSFEDIEGQPDSIKFTPEQGSSGTLSITATVNNKRPQDAEGEDIVGQMYCEVAGTKIVDIDIQQVGGVRSAEESGI